MNIMYIAGESSDFVLNLCNEFCNQGHKVTCVVQNEDSYDKENPIIPHKDIIRIDVSYKQLFTGEGILDKIQEVVFKNKFDVVFGSHAPTAPFVQHIGTKYKIPWGIMLLDIPSDLIDAYRPRMKQWLKWFDVMKHADAVIFNTEIARDEYERFTGQHFSSAYVIPYAINMPEEFNLSGVDKQGNYVISVCRLTDIKNCKIIPEALKYLDMPKKYVCVGRISDPEEFEIIKQRCEEYGVEFEHHIDVTEQQKFELIRDSLALIYPQMTEYIGGLSPFEGMYCGKPIIVPDFKVLKDLYLDYPFYYDGTALDLAKKIAFVHCSTIDKQNTRLCASNQYTKKIASFNYMAKKMLEIFERMK